jgi:hypothetical protein
VPSERRVTCTFAPGVEIRCRQRTMFDAEAVIFSSASPT